MYTRRPQKLYINNNTLQYTGMGRRRKIELFKKKKVPQRWPVRNTESTAAAQEDSTISTAVAGCRIINLKSLGGFIEEISLHSRVCNQQGEVSLIGETSRSGLASILSARCSGCRMEIAFPTSSRLPGISKGQRWEVNFAAVWGQMSTGGGYSSLQEQMSAIGIPVMTKRSFMKTEKAVGKLWWREMEVSMKHAGKEERRIAIEKGSLHDGVPAISVVLDGGWCKRSHKHSYNAKSGVGIIIGQATGKILYMGVRNKYCSVCAISEKKRELPPIHDCHKNWEGPSSSMETDIIVEGFKQAESEHGLRYTTFVGDGDSSVYPNLIAEVPGYGHSIRKLECANHAVKCYRSALEKLVQEKPQYKGKGKLTETMRKRLATAARCSIKMRSTVEDKTTAVALLREDLRNGPLHCFGIHTNCKTDYCKAVQLDLSTKESVEHLSTQSPDTDELCVRTIAEEEERIWSDTLDDEGLEAVRSVPTNSIPVDPEMLCDIQQILGRLIAKAPQLLG